MSVTGGILYGLVLKLEAAVTWLTGLVMALMHFVYTVLQVTVSWLYSVVTTYLLPKVAWLLTQVTGLIAKVFDWVIPNIIELGKKIVQAVDFVFRKIDDVIKAFEKAQETLSEWVKDRFGFLHGELLKAVDSLLGKIGITSDYLRLWVTKHVEKELAPIFSMLGKTEEKITEVMIQGRDSLEALEHKLLNHIVGLEAKEEERWWEQYQWNEYVEEEMDGIYETTQDIAQIFKLPSPTQLVEARRRGIISEDQYYDMMLQKGYAAETADLLYELSQRTYTLSQLIELRQEGKIDEATYYELAGQIGYAEEQARNLYETKVGTLPASVIIKAYRLGKITEEEARTYLRERGYDERYFDLAILEEERGLTESQLKALYRYGLINDTDVYQHYIKQGYSIEYAQKLTYLVVNEKHLKAIEDYLYSVKVMFIQGKIGTPQLYWTFRTFNYTDKEIEEILSDLEWRREGYEETKDKWFYQSLEK